MRDDGRDDASGATSAVDVTASLAELRAALAPRYVIHERIGRGASAIVYVATDSERGERVALKVLREELAAGVIQSRFVREVRIAHQLSHPNILPVHDSGTAAGRLYYTMPFIEGRSLRDRLKRERQLPLDEALAITAQIAAGLDHAHAQGVVHRDIKPANILIAGDTIVIADFGIAHAQDRAADDTLTDSGVAIGTPEYMSPEQAGAERAITGRSDVYALACVLYEMLAGEPPFTGATAQAVVARHLGEAPRKLHVIRRAVPAAVEAAIERALAKTPADRFASAGDFVTALHASPELHTRTSRSTRVFAIAGAALALLMLGDIASGGAARRYVGLGLPLDSMRIVLDADSADSMTTAVWSALERWTDLRIVRPGEAGARTAGYSISWSARSDRDSVDITAELTRRGRDEPAVRARVRAKNRASAEALGSLTDSLLFAGMTSDYPRRERARGTSLLSARRAYLQSLRAIENGDFVAADSGLQRAVNLDPQYPQALRWLATMRNWRDAPWEQIAQQAQAAARARPSLSRADSIALSALAPRTSDESPCRPWDELLRAEPDDFAAWYSYGMCVWRDSVVVRDAESTSGWRFRGDSEDAVLAFERALTLRPSLAHGYGSASVLRLQQMFMTSAGFVRRGRAAAPDTIQFRARPALRNGRLSLTPIPRQQSLLAPASPEIVSAINRQRERFHVVARRWRAASPNSAAAVEAVSVALDMLGFSGAADTLRLALRMTPSVEDSIRLTATAVMMDVKFALPDDTVSLARTVRLAHSLLVRRRGDARPDAAGALGSIAALLGRPRDAAHYARMTAARSIPAALQQIGPAYLAFAALGEPSDSIAHLRTQISIAIDALPADTRPAMHAQWLHRGAALAFLADSGGLLALNGFAAPTTAMSLAAFRRDTGAVLRLRTQLDHTRRELPRSSIGLDALYPEALAMEYVGATQDAVQWLDPTLVALSQVRTSDLLDITRAAALARAILLRAALAHRQGDSRNATRWITAAKILWHGGDKSLRRAIDTIGEVPGSSRARR